MPPIRVLQVMPAMDAGGMETFVMNVYRTIDREKVQFDFLYHYDKPCFFDDEIRAATILRMNAILWGGSIIL